MRIKAITNTTPFTTKSLLDLVRRALKVANVPKTRFEELHVRFLVGAGRSVSGHATLGVEGRTLWRGKYMLRLPHIWGGAFFGLSHAEGVALPEALRIELIAVAVHEAMHTRGAKHRDMTESQRECIGLPSPLFDGWKLEWKSDEQKPDPGVELAAYRARRFDHVRKMHAKAVTRRKRSETIEKKWAARLRRLERNQK